MVKSKWLVGITFTLVCVGLRLADQWRDEVHFWVAQDKSGMRYIVGEWEIRGDRHVLSDAVEDA